MKKLLILLTVIIYILTSALAITSPALAENKKSENSSSEKKDRRKDETEKEEKEEYTPESKYMLMIDLDSSRVLFADDADKEFKPGGFVKILTAITAIENCNDLSKKVAPEMPLLDGYDYESNGNIGLEYGEKISIRNLIEAMMTTDAGDCALVLANNIGKSYDNFIKMMNDTAMKAGAQNSVFTDPTGFDKKLQKTTLEDMGKIVQYALKNKTFVNLTSKEKIEISATNKTPASRVIFNTNLFLSKYYSLNYYNTNIKFSKTYYINNDNCGIVAQYHSTDSNLLILCAKSKYISNNSGYDDVKHLIKYAGEKFTQVTVVSENEFVHEVKIDNGYNADRVLLVSNQPIKVKLEKNYDPTKIEKKIELKEDVRAPIKKDQTIGTISVYYDKEKCGEAKLISYSDIEKSNVTYIKNIIKALVGSWYFKLIVFMLILIVGYRVYIFNKKKNS